MAKLLKLRRGTTSQHSSFTGAEGEVTVDTDKETLIVHDGSTAGGHAVAAEDMANVSSASIVGRLGTGSIVKAKLEADIIDGTKLADDAVDSEHYTNGSIDTVHIADLQITTGKIAADAITGAKIADDQINSEHYVDGSIDTAHIADAQVTHAKLAADCVDGDNIQDDVVNSEHIAAGAVDLEHMSSESVDEDNLKISNAGSNGQYLQKQSGNTGGLTWASVDFSPYAPLASPALTGTATGVNLTLSGNLTVNGTTTTVATTNTTITDNLIELNSGAGSNANDTGILIERGSTGDNAIIAWDESADKFTVGTTTATNDATGDISITTGTLVANIEGNVTGNTSGSSGSCTGNAATATVASGLTGSPNITVGTIGCGNITGTGTVSDSLGDLRAIPQNSQSSAYTLVDSDAGKHVYISSGGVTLAAGWGSTGDAVTIINHSGSDQTITQGSGVTIYNTADGSTGNRTLAGRGMCTLLKTAGNQFYISGSGLS